jgi:hypothetical protein
MRQAQKSGLLAVAVEIDLRRKPTSHGGHDDSCASGGAAPVPPNIAVQIYTQATMTKMIVHCTQSGESIDQAIAWAADELEGFMRG